jgi:hypothetical protein
LVGEAPAALLPAISSPPVEVTPVVTAVPASSIATADVPRQALLFISALGSAQVLEPGFGAEVSVGVAVHPWLDLSAAAVLGPHVGAQIALRAHLAATERMWAVQPFLEGRFVVTPLPGGVAWGGGAFGGARLRLGPGWVQAGLAVEGYRAPLGYQPFALLALAGYQAELPGLKGAPLPH